MGGLLIINPKKTHLISRGYLLGKAPFLGVKQGYHHPRGFTTPYEPLQVVVKTLRTSTVFLEETERCDWSCITASALISPDLGEFLWELQ